MVPTTEQKDSRIAELENALSDVVWAFECRELWNAYVPLFNGCRGIIRESAMKELRATVDDAQRMVIETVRKWRDSEDCNPWPQRLWSD